MSKIKCSETIIRDAYVMNYDNLNIEELDYLSNFLRHIRNNIKTLKTELLNKGRIESLLKLDYDEEEVLEGEIIIFEPNDDLALNNYHIMNKDEFDATYTLIN